MNKKTVVDRRQFLCAHIIENMPDSSALRRELLESILVTLPTNNPIRANAAVLLHHMDQFDDAQASLPFDGNGSFKGDRK
jgi:hypothetical protein